MKAVRWQLWAALAAAVLLFASTWTLIHRTVPAQTAAMLTEGMQHIGAVEFQASSGDDELLAQNDVAVFGKIDQDMAQSIALKIHMLDNTLPDDAPIVVLVNSPGGDIFAGTMIIDAMEISQHTVITVNMGLAESMGGFIFLAGDERIMWPHSMLMIHDPFLYASGNPRQVDSEVAMLKKKVAVLETKTAKMAHVTMSEYHKRAAAEWYLSADEALKAGLATEVAQRGR